MDIENSEKKIEVEREEVDYIKIWRNGLEQYKTIVNGINEFNDNMQKILKVSTTGFQNVYKVIEAIKK